MHQRTGIIVVVALLVGGATKSAAQLPSNVVPLHSFTDVPTLPKTTAALFPRYGDVSTPDGTEKGDLAGEPLRQRIDGWVKPSAPPTVDYQSMMGGAGAMTPATGEAIGQLIQTVQQMLGDYAATQQNFGLRTLPALKKAYEAQLDRIHKQYDPQIERCLTLSERAGGSNCTDPTPARDAAINAAGTAFLGQVEGPYSDYRDHLQRIAASGEAAIDRASKAFGHSTPAIASAQIAQIRQNELVVLTAALGAESDLVTYVYGLSQPPKEQQ